MAKPINENVVWKAFFDDLVHGRQIISSRERDFLYNAFTRDGLVFEDIGLEDRNVFLLNIRFHDGMQLSCLKQQTARFLDDVPRKEAWPEVKAFAEMESHYIVAYLYAMVAHSAET
ncbi:hypothetical protein L6270_00560 [Candidatus Parcubacteria bacterium]|nr:hypothetical protein [Patescibacteria group bacterium]MBU4309641.1 hypothetical protein [Patescibacteria group bacterium]MBU4432722.1 hypothetical protein [Patescibacteria group bacterium]MBU4577971.1 hypothetical protein [Patescibacteria group bacterium]MCG2696520.1 hypothetical protein [Candidatus Parcubacteria bacterium]